MKIEKVHFQSEGMKVVGNLFKPTGGSKEEGESKTPLPAVLIAGAMTGVKEQVAGQYAQRIAKAGYITLAIDHRHFGESDGMPRQHEEPAKKMEDFKNAISFLSSLNDVDNQHGDMNRNISNQQIENLIENTKVNGKDKLFMKLIFKYFLRNGVTILILGSLFIMSS
jgi:hypothetical protein